jgi:peroxiredoxin
MAIKSWPVKNPPSIASTFDPERGDFKGTSTPPARDARLRRHLPRQRPLEGTPMTIKAGDRLPNVKLTQATAEGPRPVTTDDIFKGRKVALFALPGAFTPTCSAKHLPGFKQLSTDIKAKGVDTIACLSVNDAFVMRAWAEDQAVGDDIVMLADGNAAFTDAIGLAMDGSGFGMGKRSQRYSMIVDDGVVKELNVEEGGEFRVSSAEYMMAQL